MGAPATAHERLRPLSRTEYDRMVELGWLEGEKVELLRGFIVRMSPQDARHAGTIQRLDRLFHSALPETRAAVRTQLPLALGDDSEPEPDVVQANPGDYLDAHPTTALLVIEVADSSLAIDRGEKAELYAANGIAEYWVVDLRHDLIEVYTDAVDGAYRSMTPFRVGQSVSPRAFPDVAIPVAAILGR